MSRVTPIGTLYDMLEKRGDFTANKHNVNALDDQKRPAYQRGLFPQMLYHPEGETRIVEPAEIIVTPLGPKAVGEKREIIHRLANTQEELDALLEAGWHTRPSLSAVNNPELPIPAKSPEDELELLREQLRKSHAEREKMVAKLIEEGIALDE